MALTGGTRLSASARKEKGAGMEMGCGVALGRFLGRPAGGEGEVRERGRPGGLRAVSGRGPNGSPQPERYFFFVLNIFQLTKPVYYLTKFGNTK